MVRIWYMSVMGEEEGIGADWGRNSGQAGKKLDHREHELCWPIAIMSQFALRLKD